MNKESNLKISVIVCTYNRENLLPICLESLSNQTSSKYLYEVIIVNNNSTDNTEKIAKKFTSKYNNFSLVNEENQGLSYARNKGLLEAKGKYVIYIDDDAKAAPDWCEKILNAFETINPQPIAVGGPIYPWYEKKPPEWFKDELEIRTWGNKADFLKPPLAKYGFSGSNMAFEKYRFKKYGGFSNEFGMKGKKTRLGEECELFIRIYKNEPYFWYDPSIIVYHWTPIRKTKLTYRLHRAFKAGVANSVMLYGKEKNFFSIRNLRRLMKFLICAAKVPKIIIEASNKTELVINLEKCARHMGYYIGNIK